MGNRWLIYNHAASHAHACTDAHTGLYRNALQHTRSGSHPNNCAGLPYSQTVITYTYDPLYRLTNAAYSTGEVFTYTYDAVGNRLSETKCLDVGGCASPTVTNYSYDSANRLTNVNGQTYQWDNNGNLLSDGASTYTYDAANRLTSVTKGTDVSTYTYNGLGDRLSQTVDSVTTNYVLDMNAGLTQVLADGTNTYLRGAGNGRIAQNSTANGKQYFLGDALGSVRQLVSAGGAITLARSYEPYGTTLSSAGSGNTIYQYTGEIRDASGLTFLRARYLSSYLNQWIQPDPIVPDWRNPQTLNRYAYVNNDPVNYTDPSGHTPYCGQYSREPEDCFVRSWVSRRSATDPPVGISWNPSVNVNLASRVPKNTVNAQYIVLDAKGKPLLNQNYGFNLCGQVSLSVILEAITGGKSTLQDILDADNGNGYKDAVGGDFLAALVQGGTANGANITGAFPENWQAIKHSYAGLTGSQLAVELRTAMSNGHYLLALVILQSDKLCRNGRCLEQGSIYAPDSRELKSGPDPADPSKTQYWYEYKWAGESKSVIQHWVAITGFSSQWNLSDDNSLWNWVRIVNPFDNRVEYYPWKVFRKSMQYVDAGYTVVDIWYEPPTPR